jgi:K+-sensing histidine kinase KdpD
MQLTRYLREQREHAYALALLLLGAAVLIRVTLDEIIPGQVPFLTFYPAVLVVAYWCGLGPSVLALVLAGIFGALWVPGSLYDGTRLVNFALFVAMAGVPIALIHSLQRTLERLRQHEEQVQLINRELKHRIKNLFSITNSICLQTIRAGGTTADMERSVSGRIMAIAAAQDHRSSAGPARRGFPRRCGPQ